MLPHPSIPAFMSRLSVRRLEYVELAERANGPIRKPVPGFGSSSPAGSAGNLILPERTASSYRLQNKHSPLARRAKPLFRPERDLHGRSVGRRTTAFKVFHFSGIHDKLPGNVVMGGPYGDRLGDLVTIAAPCWG